MRQVSVDCAPSAGLPVVTLALLIGACAGQPAVTASPAASTASLDSGLTAPVEPTVPDVPLAAPMLVFVPGSAPYPPRPPQLLPAQLTRRQIRATLGRARAAIGACGATVDHAPRVVRIRFRIHPHSTARDPTVNHVAIIDPKAVDPRLERCLTEQVSALVFARFQGESMRIGIGFALRRAGDLEGGPLPMPDSELVAPGAMEVDGPCRIEDIASQVPRRAFVRCLAAIAPHGYGPRSIVSLAWTIGPDGHVSNPRVIGLDLDDPVAQRCAHALERMVFRKSDGWCRVKSGNPVERP